jgi:hypothetical protein
VPRVRTSAIAVVAAQLCEPGQHLFEHGLRLRTLDQ